MVIFGKLIRTRREKICKYLTSLLSYRVNQEYQVESLYILVEWNNKDTETVRVGAQASLCLYCSQVEYRAQWFSGRVLDSRPKGRGFEPHWRHCVLVLEQDTLFLAYQEDPSLFN